MRRRLRRMSLDELLGRSRQEVSKVLDRTGLLTRDGLTPCDAIDVESFRAVGSRRFFAGAVSQRTPQLLDVRLPAVRNEVVSAADAVCRGRFDLLGYRGLLFGEPVDWHLDPVSGRRAPFTHWSRIDHLDYALVGDHKVVWELNRHQWMVGLGQAYRLTGDPCYADAFAAFVRQWMDANPRGMGINWASSLEVALRLISWCWSLCLFRDSAALSQGLFAEMLGGIWAHAAHVERYLSYYFSPNTHPTGAAGSGRFPRCVRDGGGALESRGLCVGRGSRHPRSPVAARTRGASRVRRAPTGAAGVVALAALPRRRLRGHADRLGARCPSVDFRRRPPGWARQRRPRPRRSVERAVRRLRRAVPRRSRNLLLQRGRRGPRFLPRHGGT